LCCTAPALTANYTLSLHDALPIFETRIPGMHVDHRVVGQPGEGPHLLDQDPVLDILSILVLEGRNPIRRPVRLVLLPEALAMDRSEEHTSELQSRGHLVCRLLLEK